MKSGARRNEHLPPGLWVGRPAAETGQGLPPLPAPPAPAPPPPPPLGAQPGGARAQPQPASEPALAPSQASPSSASLGGGCPGPLPSNPSPRRSAFGAGRQSPGARSWDQQPRTPGSRSQQVWGLGDPRARGGGFQRTLGGSQESREIIWVLGGWVPGMLCPPPGRQAPKERFAPSLPPPQPPQPQRCREVPLRKRVRRRLLRV